MMEENVDTGLLFSGHPILLGPKIVNHRIADQLVLTKLDRFIRKHLPTLLDYLVQKDGTIINGAAPLKSQENTDDQS